MTPAGPARTALGALGREWRLLSSGQRWTASLALALVASVLAFGLPGPFEVSSPAAAAPSTSTAPDRAAVPSAAAAPESDLLDAAAPVALRPPADVIDAPPAPGATPRPEVVLVAAPPGLLPGPSDADVARVFRDAAGLDADLLVLDPNADGLCALDLQPGTIVVTSFGLGSQPRNCLVDRGIVVLGHDSAGESGPSPSAGRSLSTARGDERSLVDLARWGRRRNLLDGKVGFVVSRRVAATVEHVLPAIKTMGVDVVATVVLDDGPTGEAQTTTGVRDLAAAGVDTVVLAATADHQRSWAARAALLAPNMNHVVSDLAGAILDEPRPPTFAGALAHTSLRVPWFERTHGPTASQQRCRATWEAGAPDTPALTPAEQHRVFAWCQHTDIVARALAATGSVVDALRQTTLDSPLTSPLAPMADQTWGPTLDVVLAYDAACTCWSEADAFASRPSEEP